MNSGPSSAAPGDISLYGVTAYVAALAVLLALIFSANAWCLLYGLDGAAWVTGFATQAAAREPFSQLGVDPLQGNFDAYYPAFREYFLPEALAQLFSGKPAGKTLTYTVYGVQLILSTFILARAVGFPRSVGLLAGILLALISLPTDLRGTPWMYGIYNIVPHLAQIVSLTAIVIACFWAMEGRRLWIAVLLALTALTAVVMTLASFVTMTVLMLPSIAVYAGCSVLAVDRWRDAVPRILAAVVCIAVPLALGAVHYLYAVASYSAFAFFDAEFMQIRGSLRFASIIYSNSIIGVAMIGLGVIGAIHAVIWGSRRLRIFAASHLVATAVFHIAAFSVVVFASNYRGPSPLYFEFMMWPIMLIFVGHLGMVIVARAAGFVGRVTRGGAPATRLATHGLICIAPLALAALDGRVAAAQQPSPCKRVEFNPIASTDITRQLEREISLVPGQPFKGLVATFTGTAKEPLDWFDLHGTDGRMWHATGNDLRTVGLWWFGIPTLFQYSPVMTPQYYLLLTEFLSRPADRQARNVVVLSNPDQRMLKLWGVRYLIADGDLAVGRVVQELPVAGQTVRLIELDDVNLGQYSPTEARHVGTFRETLQLMHDAGFDGSKTVIADRPLEGPLVPATAPQLVFQKHGFSLRATSPGASVLVLPIQYSHCWTASGSGQPVLFRANGMQLGIWFRQSLEVDLTFRFGPLSAADCRIEDVRDMERLAIRSARELRRPPQNSAR